MKIETGNLRKTLFYLTIAYIYIPLMIFFIGYEKIWIAGITIGVCFFCFWRAQRDYKTEWEESKTVTVTLGGLAICLALLAVVSYYVGWGGFAPQSSDWNKHNAILRDLVQREWPVYYQNGNETSMLIYYMGSYTFPACMGKLFHSFRVAEITLLVYNYVGLVLVAMHLWIVVKAHSWKKMLVSTWLLISFSGLFIIQYLISGFFPAGAKFDTHWFIRFGTMILQLRPNFIMLRWAFQQFIVPLLCLMLFLQYRKKVQHYVFLMLPTVLYATLSFIGIAVTALAYAGYSLFKKKVVIREILSVENILMGTVLGGNLLIYFYGSILADKPEAVGLHLINYSTNIWIYLAFIFSEFGIYVLLLWKKNHRKPLFIIITIILCVLPFFSLGLYNDLLLSAAVVPFNMLMIYILRYLFDEETWKNKKSRIKGKAIIIILFLSLWQSFGEVAIIAFEDRVTLLQQRDEWKTLEKMANRNLDTEIDFKYNYYDYDYENNIFYKYIARKKNVSH